MKEAGFHAIKKFFKLFHNFFSLGHIFALLARKLSKYQQRVSFEAAKGMYKAILLNLKYWIQSCKQFKQTNSSKIIYFCPKRPTSQEEAFLDEEFYGTETLVAWLAFSY